MKQADIKQHLLQDVQIAQATVAEHDQEKPEDDYRNAYIVGVLRSTLTHMAGLGEFPLHASCFDPETTQAIQKLIETIDQH